MFSFTRIDSNVVLIQHEGLITRASSRQLRDFLRHYRGKLVIDFSGTPAPDWQQEFLRIRSMLPQTACLHADLPQRILDGLPGNDYAMHEARPFAREAEALAWLRSDDTLIDDTPEAAVAA